MRPNWGHNPAMAPSKTEAMARLPLFFGLGRRELEFLAANVDEVDVPAGHRLITEGAPNHAFYALQTGEVEITVGGRFRRRMGPGEFFGEISMDSVARATASVTTTCAVRAFVVSHAQFAALQSNETVLFHLNQAMSNWREGDRLADQPD